MLVCACARACVYAAAAWRCTWTVSWGARARRRRCAGQARQSPNKASWRLVSATSRPLFRADCECAGGEESGDGCVKAKRGWSAREREMSTRNSFSRIDTISRTTFRRNRPQRHPLRRHVLRRRRHFGAWLACASGSSAGFLSSPTCAPRHHQRRHLRCRRLRQRFPP